VKFRRHDTAAIKFCLLCKSVRFIKTQTWRMLEFSFSMPMFSLCRTHLLPGQILPARVLKILTCVTLPASRYSIGRKKYSATNFYSGTIWRTFFMR